MNFKTKKNKEGLTAITLTNEVIRSSQASVACAMIEQGFNADSICFNMVALVAKQGKSDNWKKHGRIRSHINYYLKTNPNKMHPAQFDKSVKDLFSNSTLYASILKKQETTATKLEKVATVVDKK